VEEETCQERSERQGCPLDQEGWSELLRLQEPHRRRQAVQDHPKWVATDASPHDSQRLDDILDASNTGSQVWADSAYHSAEIEQKLKAQGLRSRIHRRAARNRPLSPTQEGANTIRSKVRARVEHVFGHQENSMGRKIVRTIGMARARFKIGMMNLGYNMRRLVQLERVAAAPA
jgi:IS5 family transposase